MLDTEIKTLGQDERISEPGFWRLPIERHHDQPCDGVSVTSGILRTMELATPADVWAFHKLNPDRYERPETDALRLGRIMAAMIEGGVAEVKKHFLLLSGETPKRPSAAQINAYIKGSASESSRYAVEFWAGVEESGKQIIKPAEWQTILQMAKVLADDPAAAAALGGEPEITMAVFDEETRLWVLSRPDQVQFSGMVSDYKKMSASGHAFGARLVDQRITAHGYDMQMALAADAFEELTQERPDTVGLVCQSDTPPYHVILRDITEEDLRIAGLRNRRALRRFRECLDMGRWPGPGDHVGSYIRPQWQVDQLNREFEMENLS